MTWRVPEGAEIWPSTPLRARSWPVILSMMTTSCRRNKRGVGSAGQLVGPQSRDVSAGFIRGLQHSVWRTAKPRCVFIDWWMSLQWERIRLKDSNSPTRNNKNRENVANRAFPFILPIFVTFSRIPVPSWLPLRNFCFPGNSWYSHFLIYSMKILKESR